MGGGKKIERGRRGRMRNLLLLALCTHVRLGERGREMSCKEGDSRRDLHVKKGKRGKRGGGVSSILSTLCVYIREQR